MKKSHNNTQEKTSLNLTIVLGVIISVALIASLVLILTQDKNSKSIEESSIPASSSIPNFLTNSFNKTNWGKINPAIEKAQNGGPGKDGIPAIDEPKFVQLKEVDSKDEVQAIVIDDNGSKKVYPYNILIWHEIVNDTANNVPVAVTFCPLCGSAVVYDRRLDQGETTFGVTGGLIESNMIMYDRQTESMWQQSTGVGIAGDYLDQELTRISFQLLTLGEVRSQYPDAKVLSENTGHNRDYVNNPYSGYDENEQFYFRPSKVDERYPSKEIFVIYEVNGTSTATPWLLLKNGDVFSTQINSETITLSKENNELTITDSQGITLPFYFEMWFSWAVQHPENSVVYDPTKQ